MRPPPLRPGCSPPGPWPSPGSASATTLGASTRRPATSYRFETLDNAHDVTFNQLLGINDEDLIAGYFGSGAAGHPNKGYLLLPPYGQANYSTRTSPARCRPR